VENNSFLILAPQPITHVIPSISIERSRFDLTSFGAILLLSFGRLTGVLSDEHAPKNRRLPKNKMFLFIVDFILTKSKPLK
jgi:hypothetical protein